MNQNENDLDRESRSILFAMGQYYIEADNSIARDAQVKKYAKEKQISLVLFLY
jgi:hypothetical protein